MTFAATGAFLFSNNAALATNNQAVGNLLVVEVVNYTNSTVWCTGLSGGGATWTQAGVKFLGTASACSAVVFLGRVTTTGAGTATPSWSGTAPSGYEINGHEFTSTMGSWAFDVQGNLDVGGGTNSWPSLTPGSGAGELYFGYASDSAGASPGTTSGYTYSVNGNSDGVAFNPNCGAGATFPVWADSSHFFGVAVLIAETAVGGAVPLQRRGRQGLARRGGSTRHHGTQVPLPAPPPFQQVTGSAAAAANSPQIPVFTGSGSLLVAVFTRSGGLSTGALTSVTDSAGNTWQLATRGSVSGQSNTRIEAWYALNAAPVTWVQGSSGTSQTWAWDIQEYTSPVYAALETASPDGSGQASSTNVVTPSITTTGPADLVIAAIHYGQATSVLTTAGLSALLDFDDGAAGSGRAAILIGAPPGSYSAAWTLGTAKAAGTLIIAFTTVAGSSPALADPAAAVDALAVTADAPLGDVAGSAEALSATVAAPLPDAAGATDSLSVTVSAPLADVAGAIEASTAVVTASLADVAGAVDAPAVAAAVPLADVAASADAVAVSIPVPQADVAAAVDALAVTVSAPLADLGAAADALTASVTVPLADAAGAADSIAVDSGSPVALAETGAATDILGVAASAVLTELAGAAEAIAVASSAGLADAAGAVDAISVAVGAAPALGDSAGALDALQVTVSVPLADSAAAVELLTPTASVVFSDVSGALDAFSFTQGVFLTGTVTWRVRPEVPRWRAAAEPARWQAEASTPRWRAEPGQARWRAQAEPARWRIMMTAFDPISSDSLEEVNVRWTADLDGTVIDPTVTPLVVQMAFPASSGNPLSPAHAVSWFTASWLAPGSSKGKGWVAQCLVGPGGSVTLAAGKYDVWSWVTGSPESPKKFAGTITVY